ncbi:hypothetical protein P4133_05595 [Pseudomonas aeruginosa]|nr:hypothetical protein [Pseudomonas aeruginosa]
MKEAALSTLALGMEKPRDFQQEPNRLRSNRLGKLMKTIYNFKQRIKEYPEYIRKAHELTLNTTKPKAGLKGTYGLLGSKEWWDNLENGSIPQKEISGTIKKVYLTGQDNTEDFNMIDIETEKQNPLHGDGT